MTTAGLSNDPAYLQHPTQQCHVCHQPYRAEDVFCPHCRIRLLRAGSTDKISRSAIDSPSALTAQVHTVSSVAHIRIVLEIDRKVLSLPNLPQIMIGRVAGTGDLPDIDLSSFGAQGFGVSRQHLKVLRDGLIYVEDMGSTNGTFINGMRLAPHAQYMLRHRDVLFIGHLATYIGLYAEKPL